VESARDQLALPLLDAAADDLANAGRVTYSMHQSFHYAYEGTAYDLQHRLVVVPRARHGNQRTLHSQVSISAPEADVRTRRDSHGNVVTDIRLRVVPESVEFVLGAVIERVAPFGDAILPQHSLRDPRMLRPSRLTAADEVLRAVANELRRASSDDLDFAQRCCTHVHDAIAYEYGVTSVATTAAEAYAGGRGVCQDHAHVMIALCRAAGVPARYVSGHLLGEGGSHAWVEVVVPNGDRARAVAFDPCNGCRAGATYITVATGRDYAHVAPTSGHYSGDARGRLTVSKRIGVVRAA
jgi:transglutaminase-like putative cysteine protease